MNPANRDSRLLVSFNMVNQNKTNEPNRTKTKITIEKGHAQVRASRSDR